MNWKRNWNAFRLLCAEWALGWVVWLAPNDKDGSVLVQYVAWYMEAKLRFGNQEGKEECDLLRHE